MLSDTKIKNTFKDNLYNYEYLFITYFFVRFMFSEIPRVSVFGYFPLDI